MDDKTVSPASVQAVLCISAGAPWFCHDSLAVANLADCFLSLSVMRT